MRAVGEGNDLWRVEVVLWAREPGAERVQEFLNAVAAATVTRDENEQSVLPDVERAWSYDIQPPEGGVGVACWVRSDSVGDAAETGWEVVRDAAAAWRGVAAEVAEAAGSDPITPEVLPRLAYLDGVVRRYCGCTPPLWSPVARCGTSRSVAAGSPPAGWCSTAPT
jgi:hypothetical protein